MGEALVLRTSVGTPLEGMTITPGKQDYVIPKGKFLTGPVVIKGDKNLVPENIVAGESIFDVPGSRRPNDLLIYTGLTEPEKKLGLWIPCEVEITTIVFAPEYNLEDGIYPEGTLILPISTYNRFQLSDMMPSVYSSAPFVYTKGELIRYTTAKIGTGTAWEPFDITIPLIQDGIHNKQLFGQFNRYDFCQTPNYPKGYSDVKAAQRNGILLFYLNQRSSHHVFYTWMSDTKINTSRYGKMTIELESTIEENIGGVPSTEFDSYAAAKIGFKTSPSSTAVDNFIALADIDPSVKKYEVNISYLNEGYFAVQLSAYEYGAITLNISSITLS